MRILVFSDSHGTLEPMRRAIERFSPDTVIHLGDYVEDSAALEREYPFQALFCVRGNCDAGHYDVASEATPCWQGVRFLAVHGHRYGVMAGLLRLSYAAQEEGAQVVLGANDKYIGLCRRHWMTGDLGPDFDGQGTGD